MMASALEQLRTCPKAERRGRLVAIFNQSLSSGGAVGLRGAVQSVMTLGSRWAGRINSLVRDESLPSPLRSELARVAVELGFGAKESTEASAGGGPADADTCTIDVDRETGTNRNEVELLLRQLEATPPGCHLRVRFLRDQVYVYGLCAIAAWASQNAADLELIYAYTRTRDYLHRSGVIEALRDPHGDPVRFDSQTFMGFTRIPPQESFDTDRHAGRLVELFSKHVHLEASASRALATAFAELIENAVRHGRLTSPAWLFATYHPKPMVMHVCISDRGIGIRESFLESGKPEIRALGEHSLAWIRACTDPLVTSKVHSHAGYGLYIVRELCRRNTGTFLLASGSASYRLAFKQAPGGSPSLAADETVYNSGAGWRGTFLGINLKLNKPLDLGPIYETLPPPRGSEDEELDLFAP